MQSRIVKVIVTIDGDTESYFTLEGRPVGVVKGGHLVPSNEQTYNSKKVSKSAKGGVVTPLSPKQVVRQKKREAERSLTLEERLKYEKEQNT